MRYLILLLLFATSLSAQVTKDVRAYNFTGRIQEPHQFFFTNVLAGANISIAWNADGTITISGGAGGGTNTLVQTNGVNVGSVGTLNFIGATGMLSGGVVAIGGFSGGSSVGTSNISVMTNNTLVVSAVTNLNYVTGTNILVVSTNVNGDVSVAFHLNTFAVTNGFVGVTVTNGLATISYVTTTSNSLYNLFPFLTTNANQFLGAPLSIKNYPYISNLTDFATGRLANVIITNALYGSNLNVSGYIQQSMATANRVTIYDVNKALTNSSITDAQLGYLGVQQFTNWGLYSTNTIVDTVTNRIKYLTNIWGDVARGFQLLSNGNTLRFDIASGFWTNVTADTETPLLAFVRGGELWLDGGAGVHYSNMLAAGTTITTNVNITNIANGQKIRYKFFATNGLTVSFPQFATSDFLDGVVVIPYTNCWTEVTFTRVGFTTNVEVKTAGFDITAGSNVTLSTNFSTRVITIDATGTGGGGGLTTNVNQFLGVPLSIISQALLTNINIKADNGAKLALTVETNIFVITNGLIGIKNTAPKVELDIGGSNPKIYIGGSLFSTTNEVSVVGLSTVGLSAQALGISNYWRSWQMPVSSGNEGSWVPQNSNAQDIASLTLPGRSNYFHVQVAKSFFLGLQEIGKNDDVFTFLGSNSAPIISINSNGFLILTNSLTNYVLGGTVPSPTNTIAIGVDNFAGRIVPTWFDDKMLQFSIQPAFFNNRIQMLTPGGATVQNFGFASVANAGGTVLSATSPETEANGLPYMEQLDCAATSNSVAGATMGSANLATAGAHNGSSKAGGYFFACEWADTNLINGVVGGGAGRHFIGLVNAASPSYTNIVNTTNGTGQYVGLMMDGQNSLNMYITARDSSAEFRTNTGVNFVNSNLYQIFFFEPHTNRFLFWKLKNLTARTEASGWFSNNVPTNWMRGAIMTDNKTNRANSIRFSKLYLEAPLSPQ